MVDEPTKEEELDVEATDDDTDESNENDSEVADVPDDNEDSPK